MQIENKNLTGLACKVFVFYNTNMSIRKVNLVNGEYYHIYNRGNSKQKIFNDKEDYTHFIKLLFLSNGQSNFKIQFIGKKDIYEFERGEQVIAVGAYCLMPNHFHLILRQNMESGISKFMQKLTTAYSMYYNKKYERTGGLFEGKFKSQNLNNDRYLKYLFSYLHLNPIKILQKDWKEIGVKNKNLALKYLDEYEYSSYQDYTGIVRKENNILNKETFPDYFPTNEKFKKEIFEWLSYGNIKQ